MRVSERDGKSNLVELLYSGIAGKVIIIVSPARIFTKITFWPRRYFRPPRYVNSMT